MPTGISVVNHSERNQFIRCFERLGSFCVSFVVFRLNIINIINTPSLKMPQDLSSSKMESVGNQAPLAAPVALAGAGNPEHLKPVNSLF